MPPQEPQPGSVSEEDSGRTQLGDDFFVKGVRFADPYRRYLLRYLSVRSPATIGEAARQVTAWEHETSPEAVTAAQRERVQRNLRDTHIPCLRTYGLVEYEESDEVLTLTGVGETVVTT